MARADLLSRNEQIFVKQGKLLDKYAKKTCKILVVGNPANTNCLIALKNAPSIPKEQFFSMNNLDHCRLTSQVKIFLILILNRLLKKQMYLHMMYIIHLLWEIILIHKFHIGKILLLSKMVEKWMF